MSDFNLSAPTIVLISACLLLGLYISIIGLRHYRTVARHYRRLPSATDKDASTAVKASVIVYTHNDAATIVDYIDSLMSQKGVDFEVIVVDDASSDYTANILDGLKEKYPALHTTFVPGDSHSLSRRKLSLTLGMKAAKNEVVVTTAACCKIQSDRWLHNIVRHFEHSGTEVVLGYSHVDKMSQKGLSRWYRSFDSLSTSALWLGYALLHSPYRGDGLNLAFRRRCFFEQNGYARTIYLHHGDDDLFINQFATGSNTRVEIAADSHLTVDWGESEARLWLDRKELYTFTARYLKTKAFTDRHLCQIARWLMIIAGAATIATTHPNIVPTLAIALILITVWGYEICLYRRTARALGGIRLWWSVPLFMLMQPLVDIVYRAIFRRRKSVNFTWRRN